ncbi:MAG TPA: undecaprenyl-diphosphate phosphatase, partial [Usitatibacter sp.]
WKDALKVGLAQCFSLIPGTSRSGATIMGAMLFGLSRQAATEFSFFLAVPVMFAASGYEMVKYRALLSRDDFAVFAVGFIVSFVFALIAVKALIRYVAHHDFNAFAWYRVALGIAVLAYFSR